MKSFEDKKLDLYLQLDELFTDVLPDGGLDIDMLDILLDMAVLYSRKNEDYGDAFMQSLDKRGMISYMVRAEDKLNRIDQLTEEDYEAYVEDESLEDSLIDLANYSVMAVMWLRYTREFENNDIPEIENVGEIMKALKASGISVPNLKSESNELYDEGFAWGRKWSEGYLGNTLLKDMEEERHD